MQLAEAFVKNRPREKGGSRAYAGLNYQIRWTFCKLLGLYGSKDDFLLIVDYHDDVAILTPARQPQSVAFYQIKTIEDGHWTIKSLTKGQPTSVLCKLYSNLQKFKKHKVQLYLVSNQRFKLQMRNGAVSTGEREFEFSALADRERRSICRAIQTDLKLPRRPVLDGVLRFLNSEISLTGQDQHSFGIFAEFLVDKSPRPLDQVQNEYNRIVQQLERRAKYTWNIRDFADLVKHKAIRKQDFDDMISIAVAYRDPNESWKRIEQRLNSENFRVDTIEEIRDAWLRYVPERTVPRNFSAKKVRKLAGLIADTAVATSGVESFSTFLDAGLLEMRANGLRDAPMYRSDYLKAALLFELTERYESRRRTRAIQTANSQSSKRSP